MHDMESEKDAIKRLDFIIINYLETGVHVSVAVCTCVYPLSLSVSLSLSLSLSLSVCLSVCLSVSLSVSLSLCLSLCLYLYLSLSLYGCQCGHLETKNNFVVPGGGIRPAYDLEAPEVGHDSRTSSPF